VLNGVLLEIEEAKQQKQGIVLLHYASSGGDMLPAILKAVQGYKQSITVQKDNDDGSIEAIRAIRKKRWPMTQIRVCGVHLGYCVAETVAGLLLYCRRRTRIVIPIHACGAQTPEEWEAEVRCIDTMSRVAIVG
jgi:hypothetical protein